MNWYIKVIKNYVNFKGRARREEFWLFVLLNCVFLFLASSLDSILDATTQINHIPLFAPIIQLGNPPEIAHGWIYILYSYFIIIPNWTVMVRRLHDTEHSGVWVLVVILPSLLVPFAKLEIVNVLLIIMFFLSIFLFIMLCKEGTTGENKYGPDPKTTAV